MNQVIKKWYGEHSLEVYELAKKIWGRPESAMEEYYACEVALNFMRKYGFDVKLITALFRNVNRA